MGQQLIRSKCSARRGVLEGGLVYLLQQQDVEVLSQEATLVELPHITDCQRSLWNSYNNRSYLVQQAGRVV